MKFILLSSVICLLMISCAPATQPNSNAPTNFPIRDGQRWFVSSKNEEGTKTFQNEIVIKGQPEKLPNGYWALYFDDNESFFLLRDSVAYLLIRYKTAGINEDEATLCKFATQINPIKPGLWTGSAFFGTTNAVIQQANANPLSKLMGFCTMTLR
jgi:hypothetical protein